MVRLVMVLTIGVVAAVARLVARRLNRPVPVKRLLAQQRARHRSQVRSWRAGRRGAPPTRYQRVR